MHFELNIRSFLFCRISVVFQSSLYLILLWRTDWDKQAELVSVSFDLHAIICVSLFYVFATPCNGSMYHPIVADFKKLKLGVPSMETQK